MLLSVGMHVARGGALRLVDLLTAGSYIQIISQSMEWYQGARQQWKDLAAECVNLDRLLALPDGEPMARSGAAACCRLSLASFLSVWTHFRWSNHQMTGRL